MYIVVVGAGKVGFNLTKALMAEGEEVLVIEKDQEKVDRLTRELDATAIQGDGAEVATLELAGLERADVVAAVTGHDEDNLVISQVAKGHFNVPRTVARINNPRNEFIFRQLGIDATVSATQLILAVILQNIPKHKFVHLLTLQEGGIEFVELEINPDSSIANERVGDLDLPPDSSVPLVIRGGKPIIAQPDTVVTPGDLLVALTTSEQETALRQRILGASGVGAAS